MKKNIAILGIGGKMGKWFAKYFLDNKYEVIGFDTEFVDKSSGPGRVINSDDFFFRIHVINFFLRFTRPYS